MKNKTKLIILTTFLLVNILLFTACYFIYTGYIFAEYKELLTSLLKDNYYIKPAIILLSINFILAALFYIRFRLTKKANVNVRNENIPPAIIEPPIVDSLSEEKLDNDVIELVDKETGKSEAAKDSSPEQDKKGPQFYYTLYPNNKIIAKFDEIKGLGYIPKVLFEVNLLLKNEPDNHNQLAAIISKDLSLTSRMLVIANSPQYGLKRKVSTIEYAIMILGIEEVKRLVTAISLSDAVRFPNSQKLKYIHYWKHSMLTGTTCRDIALKLGFNDFTGIAFMAGIFHDLGIPFLAKYFPNEYEKIMKLMGSGMSCLDAEIKVLGLTHQQIGAYTAYRWQLPDDIITIIENHHFPSLCKDNKIPAALVNLTGWMVRQMDAEFAIWDAGIVLDRHTTEILGFKSDEERDLFIDKYKSLIEDAYLTIKL